LLDAAPAVYSLAVALHRTMARRAEDPGGMDRMTDPPGPPVPHVGPAIGRH